MSCKKMHLRQVTYTCGVNRRTAYYNNNYQKYAIKKFFFINIYRFYVKKKIKNLAYFKLLTKLYKLYFLIFGKLGYVELQIY